MEASSITCGQQDLEHIANLHTLPFLHRVVMRITQKHKKGLEDGLTYRKCSTKIRFIMVTATNAMDRDWIIKVCLHPTLKPLRLTA